MDELAAAHAMLRARHARLARWYGAFVDAGQLDAAFATFLTAERVFADGCVIHGQRIRRARK